MAAKTYEEKRFQLIASVESVESAPYRDSGGFATIGIGYILNSADHANRVFDMAWGKIAALPADEQKEEKAFRKQVAAVLAKTYSSEDALQNSLFGALDGRELAITRKQAEALFKDTAPTYEAELRAKIGAVADEREHLALFSLDFNRGKAGAELLGPGIRGAIARDNHAEAWFEIRYRSNADGKKAPGQTTRRAYESQLYDPFDRHVVDLESSRELLVTRSRHIEAIAKYEKAWPTYVADANRRFAGSGYEQLAVVEEAEAIFDKAKAVLIDAFGLGRALDEVVLDYAKIEKGRMEKDEQNQLDLSDYKVRKGALMMGGAGNDIIKASDFNDVLYGEAGRDKLNGGKGDDHLDGGGGADTMTGGPGDDTYVVDNLADDVIEKSGQGTDTVRSSVSFTLGENVENLILMGSRDIDGAGNALGNVITGNPGKNVIHSGGSDANSFQFDYIDAGAGDDVIYTDTGNGLIATGAGADRIVMNVLFCGFAISDFTPGEDRIDLSAFKLPVLLGDVEDDVHGKRWDEVFGAGEYIMIMTGLDGGGANTSVTVRTTLGMGSLGTFGLDLTQQDFIFSGASEIITSDSGAQLHVDWLAGNRALPSLPDLVMLA